MLDFHLRGEYISGDPKQRLEELIKSHDDMEWEIDSEVNISKMRYYREEIKQLLSIHPELPSVNIKAFGTYKGDII